MFYQQEEEIIMTEKKSELGDLLNQDPELRPGVKRTPVDIAKETGVPFKNVFETAVENMGRHSTTIPEQPLQSLKEEE